jgi:hypothetical protein
MQDRKFQATWKTSIYPTACNCCIVQAQTDTWEDVWSVIDRISLIRSFPGLEINISFLPDLQKLKSYFGVAFSGRWVRTKTRDGDGPCMLFPLSQNSHLWENMPTILVCPPRFEALEWFAMIHKVQEIADPMRTLALGISAAMDPVGRRIHIKLFKNANGDFTRPIEFVNTYSASVLPPPNCTSTTCNRTRWYWTQFNKEHAICCLLIHNQIRKG